jgi:hypothetical protein
MYLSKWNGMKAVHEARRRYSLRQAGSTFHIGRENSEKFGLYAGNTIFNI